MDREEIVDLIIKESHKIEDLLNNDFLVRFAEMHNIKSENSYLNLKQEIVARWAYFLDTKKKYALHTVSKEGVPVDELETTGLVTRRSDYPSVTKEKVTELLNLLVMSEEYSRKRIKKYVETTEKEIRKMCREGNKGVARPVTYSKPKKNYKKIPYHIIAMDVWNDCEYEYFVPGTKGYLFNIKGIDTSKAHPKAQKMASKLTDKNKYVALPYEEDELPDYFIIDDEAMMNFAWTDRVSELLAPIEKDVYKRISEDEGIITF